MQGQRNSQRVSNLSLVLAPRLHSSRSALGRQRIVECGQVAAPVLAPSWSKRVACWASWWFSDAKEGTAHILTKDDRVTHHKRYKTASHRLLASHANIRMAANVRKWWSHVTSAFRAFTSTPQRGCVKSSNGVDAVLTATTFLPTKIARNTVALLLAE